MHFIYEIYIEKEYKDNRGGIGVIYIEDASMGTFSYLKGEMKNTTLYQLIEEMDKYLDDYIQTDEYALEFDEYVNIFDYFDERIFTLRFVFSGYYGGFSFAITGFYESNFVNLFSLYYGTDFRYPLWGR